MEKAFLGATILKRLGYLPECVDAFLNDTVLYSKEPLGSLFYLSTEMQTTVVKLALKGCIVYAAIEGVYVMSGGDEVPATSYLCLQ